jgi:membrane protease YdiL (CAAX protease family)
MVSVMPLMSGASIVLEWLYQAAGFKHPTEHELITVLGKSTDPLTTWLIIGGATLLAPVFEEFLFRGHLQTILTRVFTPRPPRMRRALSPELAFAVVMPEAGAIDPSNGPALPAIPPPPLPLPPPPLEPPAPIIPPARARWIAIAVTSLLFAVLHPSWTWPLIFLLSLTLGYAYERTANLWVPVTMHLIFNTLQTSLFLYMRYLQSHSHSL